MPLASDLCQEGNVNFPMRTEAALLNVNQWSRHDIMAHLTPRPIRHAAESMVWSAVERWLGGRMMTWPTLGGPNRMRKAPGVLWHCNTNDVEYRILAERFGVKLTESITIGSNLLPNYMFG
jgi:hypothetical protein